jgi:hypothetical protein
VRVIRPIVTPFVPPVVSGVGVQGRRVPAGRLAALSGPATFAALGGTWTLGDLSPDVWLRADTGVTVGASASVASVASWTLYGIGSRTTEGAWYKISNQADGGVWDHRIYAAVTGDIYQHAARYTFTVRRGNPPYGETVNKLWVGMTGGQGFARINLDDGSVIDGTYDDIDVAPLGASPDDGYVVTIDTLNNQDGGELQMCPLVGTSFNYRDQTGAGYFYAKDAAIDQQRVSQWDDVRGATSYVWVQGTDTHRPIRWSDARGAALSFKAGNPAVVLACPELAALFSGTALPISVAAVFESGNAGGTVFAVRNASTGRLVRLVNGYGGNTVDLIRIRDDSDIKTATVSKTAPYAGTAIGTYDGSALAIRAGGTVGTPTTQTGALTVDTAFIGADYDNAAGNPYRGLLRELAVWSRGLSAVEAAAVDSYLTAAWGY